MIYIAIAVAVVFLLVMYFENKRINNRLEKLHKDFLKELDNCKHSRFENVKTIHKVKSVVGFKHKVVHFDITFLEQNIIFEQNLKDRRKKIVHYQPISQFTFNNSNKLIGVHFIQNVREIIKERNILTLKYTRTNTLVPLKCKVQLDFSELDTDISKITDRYKIPCKRNLNEN